MYTKKFDDVSISVDSKGNVLFIGEFSVPINKENAERVFGGAFSNNPNDGLFPMIAGSKEICLSVKPDDVVKIALSKKQVSAIKQALSI
ncbi:hypothetical protein GALL_383010 [mine drainage metagenome]|uniref:Uncharacterized protein n=1 Tax=mine drainage metagenome TaxID=410659 RepID=A0A1J5Q8G1_9ZZZZ